MAKIGVFFSAGYEEIEALTVVDLCRRAGIEVTMVSVDETAAVTGSHQITVQMDQLLSETDFDAFDLLVLPGGMPAETAQPSGTRCGEGVRMFSVRATA